MSIADHNNPVLISLEKHYFYPASDLPYGKLVNSRHTALTRVTFFSVSFFLDNIFWNKKTVTQWSILLRLPGDLRFVNHEN